MRHLFVIYLMITASYATIFKPLSIKSQVADSDNVYIGEVLSVSSDYEGEEIISKVFLKLDRWYGAHVEHGHVEVYFPGGIVGENVQSVKGSAKFAIGEKVALMSKNIGERSWLMNLGLGKFSIKTLGKGYLLVNQVFPNYPNTGQIKLGKFIKLVSSVKEVKMKERFKNKYEITNIKSYAIYEEKKQGRSIASVDKKSVKKEKANPLWLLAILMILGFFKRVYNQKET
jgi:hypothetical protein